MLRAKTNMNKMSNYHQKKWCIIEHPGREVSKDKPVMRNKIQNATYLR